MTSNEGMNLNIGDAVRNGFRLTSLEAVALIHEACVKLDAGTAVALPATMDAMSVNEAGLVHFQAAAETHQPVRAAVANLLDSLLGSVTDEVGELPQSLRTLPSRLRAAGEAARETDARDLLAILRWHLPRDARDVLKDLVARMQLTAIDERSAVAPLAPQPRPQPAAQAVAANAPQVIAPSVPQVIAPFPPRVIASAPRVIAASAPQVLAASVPKKIATSVTSARQVMPVSAPPQVARPRRLTPALAWAAALLALVVSGYAGYLYSSSSDPSAPAQVSAQTGAPAPSASAPAAKAPLSSEPGTAPAALPRDPQPIGLAVTGGAFSPSFTASRNLLFHAGRNGTGHLFTATLDDQGRASALVPLLNESARNYHVRPSPDGRWIAFDSDREGERAVFIAARGGDEVTRVSGEGFAAVPSWSPDMKTLAFIRSEPGRPKVWNLWTRELATGTVSRATSFRSGQVWGASWFPDSASYAYSHENRLLIADRSSRQRASFASPVAGRLVRTPAVSPNGREIIFQVFRDGAWMLDIETGAMRRVLDDASAEEFAWSPDGRRIAYHSRRDGDWRIWLMTP